MRTIIILTHLFALILSVQHAGVRTRVHLLSTEDKGAGRALIKTKNTVEIEGEEKPALVAEMRVLLVTK
jgi:acyl dehydratase